MPCSFVSMAEAHTKGRWDLGRSLDRGRFLWQPGEPVHIGREQLCPAGAPAMSCAAGSAPWSCRAAELWGRERSRRLHVQLSHRWRAQGSGLPAVPGQPRGQGVPWELCARGAAVEKKERGPNDLQEALKSFIDPLSKVFILFLLLLKIGHQ